MLSLTPSRSVYIFQSQQCGPTLHPLPTCFARAVPSNACHIPLHPRPIPGWWLNSRVMWWGDPVMRQGIVHFLHVHHIILFIPNAVLSWKQIREELGESQTQRRNTVVKIRMGLCQHREIVALICSLNRWSLGLPYPNFQYRNSDSNRLFWHVSLTYTMVSLLMCILKYVSTRVYACLI